MTSFDLEARNGNLDTEERLLDGERHLGAGLDGAGEGELGLDGDGGPGMELQRVRQYSQLINTSGLWCALCGKIFQYFI